MKKDLLEAKLKLLQLSVGLLLAAESSDCHLVQSFALILLSTLAF